LGEEMPASDVAKNLRKRVFGEMERIALYQENGDIAEVGL